MTISPPVAEVPDALAAIDYYFEHGWSDGLPVVPPTEATIRAMLDAARLDPHAVVGEVPARRRRVTAEKIAINAVMAGCRPEYMPVLVAAVEALCDPDFGVHGPSASTSGMGCLTIVHGPVARRLGMNAGENLFGPGNRANATIGRTLRLVLMNAIGALPGKLDRSVLGHPGKYTYAIAELETVGGWPPLHVDRGFAAGTSAVTVFACEAPHQVANDTARTPEEILGTIADVMAAGGRLEVTGQEFCVVLGPLHAESIAAAGWSKADVRRFLHERAVRAAADLARMGRLPRPAVPGEEPSRYAAVERPEDLLVLVAGGNAGAYSAVMPGWVGRQHSRAATRPVAA